MNNNDIINDDTFKTILKIALSVFKDTLFYNLEGINQDGWIVADKYHPLYGLIAETFKRETYYKSGVNPQDVVNSVLDTFCLIGKLQQFSYLKKIDDETMEWSK